MTMIRTQGLDPPTNQYYSVGRGRTRGVTRGVSTFPKKKGALRPGRMQRERRGPESRGNRNLHISTEGWDKVDLEELPFLPKTH